MKFDPFNLSEPRQWLPTNLPTSRKKSASRTDYKSNPNDTALLNFTSSAIVFLYLILVLCSLGLNSWLEQIEVSNFDKDSPPECINHLRYYLCHIVLMTSLHEYRLILVLEYWNECPEILARFDETSSWLQTLTLSHTKTLQLPVFVILIYKLMYLCVPFRMVNKYSRWISLNEREVLLTCCLLHVSYCSCLLDKGKREMFYNSMSSNKVRNAIFDKSNTHVLFKEKSCNFEVLFFFFFKPHGYFIVSYISSFN